MPYILQTERERLSYHYDGSDNAIKNSGQLNYLLTEICLKYLDDQEEHNKKPVGYSELNDVIGALESCKLEFYRRLAVPYENSKIDSNGDVY